MSEPITRRAPAKLNLTLAVVGRRLDGYHDLHSVMVPLSLADTVTVAVAASQVAGDTLWVDGSERSIAGHALSAGPSNLVLRAIAETRAALRAAQPGVDTPYLAAGLTKRVPVASGLGGGSSDAAAAMNAALEAWGATLPPETMLAVAASLGSDVPFFLAKGAALVTGRGEQVQPLPQPRGVAPSVLLVTPRIQMSTAAVFAVYAGDIRHAAAEPAAGSALAVSERLAADLSAALPAEALLGRAADLAAANDLVPATLTVAPELAAFRRRLAEILGRPVGQSGSGPTAWVLYETLADAMDAVDAVNREMAAAGHFVADAAIATGPQ